ncbi:MAG: SIR2 family NAD-dependent protein deacylase [Limisphaerales bacterium]
MQGRLKRTFVITGAGISAESGVPTFRGKDGYWRNHDPTKLATAEAFRNDPELVWEWYRDRRSLVESKEPNAAHEAVVQLAQMSDEFLLLTQNVDNLHQRAKWNGKGLSPDQMVQIHGRLLESHCFDCGSKPDGPDPLEPNVPICQECGGNLRPSVVWFGENLDPDNARRVDEFVQRPCDLVIVIGTTAAFGYITHWAVQAGASSRIIEINPEPSLTHIATDIIARPAAKALPELVKTLSGV